MKYTLTIDIKAPRDVVVGLFQNQERFKEWQPSLMRLEAVAGAPGEQGSTRRLFHKMGPRDVEMLETIVEQELPDRIVATYEAKKVYNHCVNRFVELPNDGTRYVFETEFKCSGPMWIMTKVMPGMFKKSSQETLERFRAFVETEARKAQGSPETGAAAPPESEARSDTESQPET